MSIIASTKLLPSSRTDKRPTDSTGKATHTLGRESNQRPHPNLRRWPLQGDSNQPTPSLRNRSLWHYPSCVVPFILQLGFKLAPFPPQVPAATVPNVFTIRFRVPRSDPGSESRFRVPSPSSVSRSNFRVRFRSPIVDPVSGSLPHGGGWVSARGSNPSFLKRVTSDGNRTRNLAT